MLQECRARRACYEEALEEVTRKLLPWNLALCLRHLILV